jgi:hypothetical protein
MDFPRFQSGQIGNLTYAHLNEAFSLLDRLRPLLIAGGEGVLLGEAMLIARITAVTSATGLMQWVEVVPSSATTASAAVAWTTRVGGRKSGAPTDANFDPCVVPPAWQADGAAPVPNTVSVNSVVILRKTKRIGGKSIWTVFSTVAAKSDSFPARIVGSQAMTAFNGTVYRWKYAWDEVTITNPVTLDWVVIPPSSGGRFGRLNSQAGNSGPAINTLETNGIVGIGGTGPSLAIETPTAIAGGVVVDMKLTLPDGSPIPNFSAGPALSVNCGN